MENICDRILELDYGRCFMHDFGGPGAYGAFREARAARRAAQASAAADARTLFRREAEWMRRQPKARQAKSRAREAKFYELGARAADVPVRDAAADFGSGPGMLRQGGKVLKMEGIGYTLPGAQSPLIKDFTYAFARGERLGVAGRNGAGKSTLLNLIAGTLPPSVGTREPGETTAIGYFTQFPPPVRPDVRVVDYVREVADDSKARLAGLPGADAPEVLLEKVRFRWASGGLPVSF
eukprot:365911-Chlamydomonas_euryale.AAC.13